MTKGHGRKFIKKKSRVWWKRFLFPVIMETIRRFFLINHGSPKKPTKKKRRSFFFRFWSIFFTFLLSSFLTIRSWMATLRIPRFFSKRILSVLLVIFSLVLIAGGILVAWTVKDLPNPRRLSNRDIEVTTKIYDRKGRLLYKIYNDRNRTLITLDQVSPSLKQATIAIEDKDFYNHKGFAPRGMLRAAKEISSGKGLQGGSTITQQLVKNALLTPERTVERKIKELFLAFQAELIYSKDEILTMYFNEVAYGGTAWGAEEAAEMYFGKKASELTLAESALMAGLPAAPTTFSPFGAHPELAKQRQAEVLRRMVEDKYISQKEADEAAKAPLVFANHSADIKAPHFVMYVRELLEKKYGAETVSRGGLTVITSLDLDIQEAAQKAVTEEVTKLAQLRVGNGAAVITAPKTGEILAMVGSRDYFDKEHDGNVNVTTAPRQPGSSIKPLNYALGFTKGYTPATVFADIPTEFKVAGQPPYKPVNYDGAFHGPVQARFALGNSYNIPAVKMLAVNGVPQFVSFANRMGLTTLSDPSRYGLSLTLGGGEVKMVDMAVAFGVFANGGVKQELSPILKITDYRGRVLEELKPREGERVLSEEISYLISHILLDNNARSSAFGSSSALVIPKHSAVSVKTGTTDDKRDNWTIGYTPSYLVAVWVGNNDNTAMHPYLTSGITGAAPIWNKIMTGLLKDKPDEWPKKPDTVIGMPVCSISGKLPANDCPIRYEFFVKGTEPKDFDDSKRKVFVNKQTGKQAKAGDTDVEERDAIVISDPLVQNVCVSCNN